MAAKNRKRKKVRILQNPITIKQMAEQVKIACDHYNSLNLEEKDFEALLQHYARNHGNRFFGKNGSLNPTLEKIIGKKRKELVNIMLKDHQMSLFD